MITFAMPPEHSGAARQAITLASQLAAQGLGVFFLTMRSTPESIGVNEVAGFQVIRVPKTNPAEKAVAPLRVFATLFRERARFDVIHVHGVGYLSTVAVLFAGLFGKKTVIKMTMFAEDDPLSVKARRHGWITFAFLARASRVVAITESFYHSCLAAGLLASRIALIPNGVDTRRFHPVTIDARRALRRRLQLPEADTLLVYAGIIRPEKGIDFLLDMMSVLKGMRATVGLVLLGPLESWLPHAEQIYAARQVARMQSDELSDVVQFLPGVENVHEYFEAADIFVSASLREGFPNVLLEAMASGLAPIVREVPEVHVNVLEYGVDGLVLRDPSPAAFADRVAALVDDPELRARIGAAAAAKASAQYSVERVRAAYLELYQDLLF